MTRARCGEKWVYPTFEEAVHSALIANRRRGTPLRPYDCSTCGGWHLTKRPANPAVATVPGPFTPSDMARLINQRGATT